MYHASIVATVLAEVTPTYIYRLEFVSGTCGEDELPEGRTADSTMDTGAKQRDVDLIEAKTGLP